MTVTTASFRGSFPAFLSSVAFSDEAIEFWLGIAQLMLNPNVFGSPAPTDAMPVTSTMDWGTLLYVAHHLILEKQSNDAVARGGTPGVQKGAVNSDSANDVSRSYDVSAGLELEAGHWGQTTYGNRFIALVKMVGTGPITVAGGGAWGGGFGFGAFYPMGNPWLGPPPVIGPSGFNN